MKIPKTVRFEEEDLMDLTKICLAEYEKNDLDINESQLIRAAVKRDIKLNNIRLGIGK